jgi:FkbM family methyltransferase
MELYKVQNHFYPYRILDIGANIGQFHQLAKQTFPDTYVFSIEASKECEQYLKEITNNYYIGLLTKDNSEYDFYSRKDTPIGTGNSIYRELTSFYSDNQIKIIKQKGIKLDDIFTEDTEFDLIKIDTQGSELDIIKGGINLCKKAKGILLEVSLTQYNENAPLYDEVIQFMDDFGYKPIEEIGYGHHPLTNQLIQKDILFLKTI